MKTEHAIKYLDDLAEKPANQQKHSWDMVEAIRAGRNALQENLHLRELLRLAVEDMRHGYCCEICAHYESQPSCDCECLDCKLEGCQCSTCTDNGKFTWQHADKLKKLEVEV